jgi:hypothetical protein
MVRLRDRLATLSKNARANRQQSSKRKYRKKQRTHSISLVAADTSAFHFSTAPPALLSAKLRMSLVELFSVGRVASARYPLANSVPTSEVNGETDQDQIKKILLDEAKH